MNQMNQMSKNVTQIIEKCKTKFHLLKDLLHSPFRDSQQYSSSDRKTLSEFPEFPSNEPYFFMDKLTKVQETSLLF